MFMYTKLCKLCTKLDNIIVRLIPNRTTCYSKYIYLNINTCIIIPNDQLQQQRKRSRQPSGKFSDPPIEVYFDDNVYACNSVGPFTNAMRIAPPIQMTVPIILAMPLQLRTLTFSNLIIIYYLYREIIWYIYIYIFPLRKKQKWKFLIKKG